VIDYVYLDALPKMIRDSSRRTNLCVFPLWRLVFLPVFFSFPKPRPYFKLSLRSVLRPHVLGPPRNSSTSCPAYRDFWPPPFSLDGATCTSCSSPCFDQALLETSSVSPILRDINSPLSTPAFQVYGFLVRAKKSSCRFPSLSRFASLFVWFY